MIGRFIITVAALVMCSGAASQQRFGVVKYSANFMRAKPDYEAGLETQALMGTPVKILSSNRYWLEISTPDYTAWTTDMGVVQMDSTTLEEYIAAPKCICTALWSEILASPKKDAARISDLVVGDLLRIKVNADGKTLKTKSFIPVILPDGKEGYIKSSDAESFNVWAETRSAIAANLITTANRFLGTPYLWGGYSSKGLDCSGFVKTVFFLNGVVLYRNASQQAREGIEVPLEGFIPGKSEGNLRPGDLLFFGRKATLDSRERITHVALYIGNGCIIHSSQEVRINSLDPSSENYYSGAKNIVRARRICDVLGNPYTSVRVIDSPAYFIRKN